MQYGCNILENCSNMFNNFQSLNFFIKFIFLKSKHFAKIKEKLIKKFKLCNLCCT
jgi:hypothetical protein